MTSRTQAALLFVALIALVVHTIGARAGDALGELPPAKAEALDQTNVTLPDSFTGDANLVVMSFARNQADDLDAWYEAGDALPGVTGYRFLLMGGVPKALRGVVEKAMRKAVPSADAQGRYLLYYGDGSAYLDQLGLTDTSQLLVMLVDRSGRTRWSHRGPVDDEALAALRAAASE